MDRGGSISPLSSSTPALLLLACPVAARPSADFYFLPPIAPRNLALGRQLSISRQPLDNHRVSPVSQGRFSPLETLASARSWPGGISILEP